MFSSCARTDSQDVLERHQIVEVLAASTSFERGCELLVAAAIESGADDDVTVALVRPGVCAGSLQ
jgi:serine/threonine protein phosphatase PrpC